MKEVKLNVEVTVDNIRHMALSLLGFGEGDNTLRSHNVIFTSHQQSPSGEVRANTNPFVPRAAKSSKK
jgi:hypothetical protein